YPLILLFFNFSKTPLKDFLFFSPFCHCSPHILPILDIHAVNYTEYLHQQPSQSVVLLMIEVSSRSISTALAVRIEIDLLFSLKCLDKDYPIPLVSFGSLAGWLS